MIRCCGMIEQMQPIRDDHMLHREWRLSHAKRFLESPYSEDLRHLSIKCNALDTVHKIAKGIKDRKLLNNLLLFLLLDPISTNFYVANYLSTTLD